MNESRGRQFSLRSGLASKIDIYFLPIALASYVGFWIALAIHPLDRGDWLLENLLIFISIGVFGFSRITNFNFPIFPTHSSSSFSSFIRSARITLMPKFQRGFG